MEFVYLGIITIILLMVSKFTGAMGLEHQRNSRHRQAKIWFIVTGFIGMLIGIVLLATLILAIMGLVAL